MKKHNVPAWHWHQKELVKEKIVTNGKWGEGLHAAESTGE